MSTSMLPALAAVLLTMSGCGVVARLNGGDHKEPADDPPPATAALAPTGGAGFSFTLDSATVCKLDPESGYLLVVASDKDTLMIEVRGYAGGDSGHRCTQAPANVTGDAELYEGCAVEAAFSRGPTGREVYAMHRSTPSVRPFAYQSECNVVLSEHGRTLEGRVACRDMAQVVRSGLPVNPVASDGVHPDFSGDLDASFRCELERAKP